MSDPIVNPADILTDIKKALDEIGSLGKKVDDYAKQTLDLKTMVHAINNAVQPLATQQALMASPKPAAAFPNVAKAMDNMANSIGSLAGSFAQVSPDSLQAFTQAPFMTLTRLPGSMANLTKMLGAIPDEGITAGADLLLNNGWLPDNNTALPMSAHIKALDDIKAATLTLMQNLGGNTHGLPDMLASLAPFRQLQDTHPLARQLSARLAGIDLSVITTAIGNVNRQYSSASGNLRTTAAADAAAAVPPSMTIAWVIIPVQCALAVFINTLQALLDNIDLRATFVPQASAGPQGNVGMDAGASGSVGITAGIGGIGPLKISVNALLVISLIVHLLNTIYAFLDAMLWGVSMNSLDYMMGKKGS